MIGDDKDSARATPDAASPAPERRPGLRAIAIAGARVARPIVARRGGGMLARLKADWRAITDGPTGAQSWPDALSRDGVLKLRVAVPAAALELQHRAPLLIERINLFFGHLIVARIVLVQGPLPLAAATPPPPPLDSPNPTELAALDRRLAGIADPALRAALAGLGRALLGRGRR